MPDVMTTLRATRAALAHAALLPLVVAMAINLIGRIFARAWRSHLLLRGLPEGKVRFGELLGLLAAGYAAGMVLWGPAAEVL